MQFNEKLNLQEWAKYLENLTLSSSAISYNDEKYPFVEEAYQAGTLKITDKNIPVFYLKLTQTKISTRIKISQFIQHIIPNNFDYTSALAFIEYSDDTYEGQYRLSYVKVDRGYNDSTGKYETIKSNPRRYTFVLGEGIPTRTPEQQLKTEAFFSISSLEHAFSVEPVTKAFYNELSDWYAWAVKKIKFPNKIGDTTDDDKYNTEGIIRLITRLIFVWFLKQKQLIPNEFFDEKYIADNLIAGFNPHKMDDLFDKSSESKYYKAILQNLFFAMLNSPITPEGKDTISERRFKNSRSDFDNNKLMRYKSMFKKPKIFVDLANKYVPFLNGGLFDCLDDKSNKNYIDGFSDRDVVKKTLIVPDYLFFGEEVGRDIDLSEFYGDKNKKKVSARGIIDILKRYNFTIEENTPFDQEISLDPELLGKVFENLLASFNPETKTTARKQTGSFYTPREIVQYMVDESLIAHLKRTVGDELDAEYRKLMKYTSDTLNLTSDQKKAIMKALYDCKILDPACGSGAFPMGILQQMVHILAQLDPDNNEWKEMLMENAIGETTDAYKNASHEERAEIIKDIEQSFDEDVNRPDYARKLYLIERCIFGVDIQSIAVQISKLRFFISLVVDQKANENPAENFGIRPLPNLEAKFIAANTLIGLNKKDTSLFDTQTIKIKEAELKSAKHKIFGAKTYRTKNKYKKRVAELRSEIATLLKDSGAVGNDEAHQLQEWDMFDQNASSPFFDAEWMFGVEDGFDIVIGNPPYVVISNKDIKKQIEIFHPEFKRNNDLYAAFFSESLNILMKKGVLSLITPNSYLIGDYFCLLRQKLSKNKIISIVDFNSTLVFESATVFSAIIVMTKDTPHIKWELKSDLVTHKGYVDSDSTIFRISNPIFEKLISNVTFDACFLIKDVGYNYWSIGRGKVRGNSVGSRVLYKGVQNDSRDIKYIKGANFNQYTIPIPENYLRHNYKEFLSDNDIFRFTANILEHSPKIIYRQTANRIIATIDEASFHTDKTVHTIINRSNYNYDLYSVLGILNSKLMHYLYKCSVQEEGRAFAQVKTIHIKRLPFIYNEEIFIKISELVYLMFEFKINGKDVIELENQIDHLVYELYDLTDEEIKIVEER